MRKIVLVLMLVLGFGLTNASANENTPEGVILDYFEALVSKDVSKAVSLMSKKEFTRPDRRTKQMVDKREEYTMLEMGGIHSYAVKDPKQWQFKVEKRDGFYTLLKRNPTHKNWKNDSYYDNWGGHIVIKVVKENGAWKISSIVG